MGVERWKKDLKNGNTWILSTSYVHEAVAKPYGSWRTLSWDMNWEVMVGAKHRRHGAGNLNTGWGQHQSSPISGLRETCLVRLGRSNRQISSHEDVYDVQWDLSGCDNGGTADWKGWWGENTEGFSGSPPNCGKRTWEGFWRILVG